MRICKFIILCILTLLLIAEAVASGCLVCRIFSGGLVGSRQESDLIMADPLSLLRQFNVAKKPIAEKDGLILFGDLAFPRDAKTSYVKYGTGKESIPKDYYTLECLVFFLKNVKLRHPVYVKRAVESEVPIVNLADRKDLLALLQGEVNASENVDKSAPLALPVQIKRQAEAALNAEAVKKPRIEDAEQVQKEKERLASILDAPSLTAGPKIDNIRDLSEKLTAEKIAAIKNKFLAKKRGTIQPTEEDMTRGSSETRYLDMDTELDVARDILTKEREWRTRSTCLEAPSKNFSKTILPILQQLKARDEGKTAQVKSPSAAGPGLKTYNRPTQPTTYNRYAQEALKSQETGEFKIDTLGTYHGITLKSITEGARPKAAAPVESTSAQSSVALRDLQPSRPQKRTSRTPIIIIPAATTSLITTYNARDLLQDLKYVSSDEKKASGMKRDSQLLVQRTKEGGVTVPYQVVDNPLKLNPADWDRVVAVFVQGPAWQFKGWPWNGNPVDIFSRICAFHLKWDEVKLDANVAKWNVHVLTLSLSKRHLDRASMLRFWETLDRYMLKYKSHLRV